MRHYVPGLLMIAGFFALWLPLVAWDRRITRREDAERVARERTKAAV